MIKGIIFDIDGTILDSFESIYLTLSNVLKKYNVEDLTREELKAMMDYMSFEEIVLNLAKKYNILDSEKILELSKDYIAYFKKSIKYYGIDLKEIVYIGDQPKDIIEARLAGVRSIAVTYGVSKYDTLLKEHPDYFADNAKELLEIIQKN